MISLRDIRAHISSSAVLMHITGYDYDKSAAFILFYVACKLCTKRPWWEMQSYSVRRSKESQRFRKRREAEKEKVKLIKRTPWRERLSKAEGGARLINRMT